MGKSARNIFLAGFLSLLLTISLVAGAAGLNTYAYADDLSDAQASLDAASKQLDSITQEYKDIENNIAVLESQMQETTSKVMSAQNAMLKGQDILGSAVKASYKSEGNSSLVSVFLMSEDLGDFLKNITYYSAIQQDQAELVEEQKDLRSQFAAALSELESQKRQQDATKKLAAAKKSEAEKVVSEASEKVSAIEAERERIAELQAKAAQMEQQKQQENTPDPGWNTNTDESSDGDDNGGGSAIEPSEGWQTGVASAYGGSSDPYTPNPGRTATGAVCDDDSMGVAVPMVWSNYWQYYGHAVEISYGSRSVIATVNDCGYMGGGSRSLDLQPGVFKALGFSTCQAWGIRTVSYRILQGFNAIEPIILYNAQSDLLCSQSKKQGVS